MWNPMQIDKSSYYMFREFNCMWFCTGCLVMCEKMPGLLSVWTLTQWVTTRGQSSSKNLSRLMPDSVVGGCWDIKDDKRRCSADHSFECKLLITTCNYVCITHTFRIKPMFVTSTSQGMSSVRKGLIVHFGWEKKISFHLKLHMTGSF